MDIFVVLVYNNSLLICIICSIVVGEAGGGLEYKSGEEGIIEEHPLEMKDSSNHLLTLLVPPRRVDRLDDGGSQWIGRMMDGI